MKWVMCYLVFSLFLTSLMTLASDEQAVYDAHIAWISAFEQADIAAIDAIWTQAPDVILVTIFGEEIKGWQKVQKQIKTSFVLTGRTTIIGENLVITVSDNKASATMDYRWSPFPNIPLKATELYRKENGGWKMIAQDGTGGLEPLRRNAENRVRERVQQTKDALVRKDFDALQEQIADDDFTFVNLNGTVHPEFDKAIIGKDLEKIREFSLEVIFLTDDTATAHLTLTLIGNNEQKAQFVIKNFQLTKLDFAPKPLAVQPKGKLIPTWARIKTGTPD